MTSARASKGFRTGAEGPRQPPEGYTHTRLPPPHSCMGPCLNHQLDYCLTTYQCQSRREGRGGRGERERRRERKKKRGVLTVFVFGEPARAVAGTVPFEAPAPHHRVPERRPAPVADNSLVEIGHNITLEQHVVGDVPVSSRAGGDRLVGVLACGPPAPGSHRKLRATLSTQSRQRARDKLQFTVHRSSFCSLFVLFLFSFCFIFWGSGRGEGGGGIGVRRERSHRSRRITAEHPHAQNHHNNKAIKSTQKKNTYTTQSCRCRAACCPAPASATRIS